MNAQSRWGWGLVWAGVLTVGAAGLTAGVGRAQEKQQPTPPLPEGW